MHDVLNNHQLTKTSYVIFGGQVSISLFLSQMPDPTILRLNQFYYKSITSSTRPKVTATQLTYFEAKYLVISNR